jgi:hypothetical protein
MENPPPYSVSAWAAAAVTARARSPGAQARTQSSSPPRR